ncbi:hypothetical protein, partial [Psychrosphaera sp. B3R10]|uniref:hypothetical protein n=1 Tax=Psychrosphaera sp. B3R10 TaxID=2841569 RepID=UPI00352D1D95
MTIEDAAALAVEGSMGSFVVTEADSVTDSGALAITGASTIDTSGANGSVILDEDT